MRFFTVLHTSVIWRLRLEMFYISYDLTHKPLIAIALYNYFNPMDYYSAQDKQTQRYQGKILWKTWKTSTLKVMMLFVEEYVRNCMFESDSREE
jgi:hypothetical protein